MAQLTRHTFIKKTSAGAATLGAAAALPGIAAARTLPAGHAGAAATLHGPLVAHVRDAATGEIALLVGTREIIVHDHALVRRLIKAAQS